MDTNLWQRALSHPDSCCALSCISYTDRLVGAALSQHAKVIRQMNRNKVCGWMKRGKLTNWNLHISSSFLHDTAAAQPVIFVFARPSPYMQGTALQAPVPNSPPSSLFLLFSFFSSLITRGVAITTTILLSVPGDLCTITSCIRHLSRFTSRFSCALDRVWHLANCL